MSGSALSPWAFVQEPLQYALQTATQLECPVPKDLYRQYESLLQCLRQVPVEKILKVRFQTSPFLVTVGPSADGVTIKADWKDQLSKMGREGRTPVDVLMGTTSMHLFEIFSEDEMRRRFDDERRSLLLETFIRHNYRFHLPEITLAIKAAYTDWTKAIEDGNGIRDLTGEALHDASIVSPMTMLACQIHSSFRATYFYVLEHKIEGHYPEQRSNGILTNELPYIFGGPLGSQSPATSRFNFTKEDVVLSESIIAQWTNFMKFGHPRNLVFVETFGDQANKTTHFSPEWPTFDPNHQRYYELGMHGRSRDHYRAGNVALWSWLVPELERVGSRYGKDSSSEESTQIFPLNHLAGSVQKDFLPRNLLPSYNTTAGSPSTKTSFSGTVGTAVAEVHKKEKSGPSETLDTRQARNDLPYTTAFSVTVAIACSLLILNMVVLTIVYYRYDSKSKMRDNVQLHVAANPAKPIYHTELYSKLSSSATLHSDLAASFEGDNHDWPPDYASSCNVVCRDVSSEKRNSHNIFDRSVLQHPNVSPNCRAPALVMRQPLASYTSAVDGQLVPLNFPRCKTSEMEV
ncbi:neuroligin-3-like [Macrobrachium rosenbergii]|uniref:neuroligin-3-like n=1 Tax=Macrobrachium rosenbergii TaxID=79674 RepID=UPI0034D76E91